MAVISRAGARDLVLVVDRLTAIGAVRYTEHPIEDGGVVVDHATRLPDRFRLEGYVQPEDGETVPQTTDRALRFFEGSVGELHTLVLTNVGTVSQIGLEGWQPVNTPAGGVRYVLECRQLVFATSQSVEIPPRVAGTDGLSSAAYSGAVTTTGSLAAPGGLDFGLR